VNIDSPVHDADKCGAHCHDWYLWLDLSTERKMKIKKVIYYLGAGGVHSRWNPTGISGGYDSHRDAYFSHNWEGHECFTNAKMSVVPQHGDRIDVPFNLCAVPDAALPPEIRIDRSSGH
jgi:hypothetical protein